MVYQTPPKQLDSRVLRAGINYENCLADPKNL